MKDRNLVRKAWRETMIRFRATMGFAAGKSEVSDHDTVPGAVKLCVADQ